ncbi:MAG: hypothetical protein ACKV0T_04800 [Planctomycetales bacterium]
MGFFENLFRKKVEIEVHDPVFGVLSFAHGIWTHVPREPNAGFMVTVDAPESGPTDRQRDFFQSIRANLPDFEHRANDFIRRCVDESLPLLSVYSVEIGTDDETGRQEFVLELSDDDAHEIHRVQFRAGEPVDYDGFED